MPKAEQSNHDVKSKSRREFDKHRLPHAVSCKTKRRDEREEHEHATSRDVKRDGQQPRGETWTSSPQQTSTKRVVEDNKKGKSGYTAGERDERTCSG